MIESCIEFLGKKKLLISKDETKECNFYLIKAEKNLDVAEIECKNKIKCYSKDFFILNEAKMHTEEAFLNIEKDFIIVTFDERLSVNDEVIKSKRISVTEDLVEDFLYTIVLYHLKNNDFKNAEIVLAETKDVKAYINFKVLEGNLDNESIIKEIERLITNKEKRFIKGKKAIRLNNEEKEKITLIELLKDILKCENSKLLWNYSSSYERVGRKRDLISNGFKFNKLNNYGEVTDIVIGSKKINIGIGVLIKGQVENLKNNLKLDACIYREYNLIANGQINNKTIWCTLSKELKRKLSKQCIINIITNSRYNNEQVYSIDINELPITAKKELQLLNKEDVARYLFDIEALKIKISYLKKEIQKLLIKNKDSKICFNNNLSEEQMEVRKQFGVNYKNIYCSEFEEYEEDYSLSIVDVIDWKIEKFPIKKTEEAIKKEIELIVDSDINSIYRKYNLLLNRYKEEKRDKELIVNIIRVSGYILNKDIFNFNEEEYKNKKIYDKELENNMVLGGKVKVSREKVNEFNIKQEKYKLVIKHS